MKHFINLHVFDEGAVPASAEGASGTTPSAASREPAKAAQASGGYSYAQAEEIATARAQKAERAALASYFKQQGMTEDEVTNAIKAYKAAQKAKEPDVGTLTRERDEARAKVAAYEQKEALGKKGVKAEFAEFVAFKARELMAKDDKLDTFDKAAEKFLKDNPHYASQGTKPASYKIKTATDANAGGGQDKAAETKAALNVAIKQLARRK